MARLTEIQIDITSLMAIMEKMEKIGTLLFNYTEGLFAVKDKEIEQIENFCKSKHKVSIMYHFKRRNLF